MIVPGWIAVLIACVVIALVIWQLVRALLRERAAEKRWTPLLNVPFPCSYASTGPGPVNVAHLQTAIGVALSALATYGPWGIEELTGALTGIRIWISEDDVWESIVCASNACRKGQVAGQSFIDAGMVVVGVSLAALAHEFAHIAEARIDGQIDYDHVTWPARRITLSIAEYEKNTAPG